MATDKSQPEQLGQGDIAVEDSLRGSRSKRRRLNFPDQEKAFVPLDGAHNNIHVSSQGAQHLVNCNRSMPDYEEILEPQSPRTLHNKAPQHTRSLINGRHWQLTDPHETICAECGKGSDLINCKTCPKSWHPWCIVPHFTPCSPPESWFCQVCIDRGWNELDFSADGTIVADPLSHVPMPGPCLEGLPSNSVDTAGWNQPFMQGTSNNSDIADYNTSPGGFIPVPTAPPGQNHAALQTNLHNGDLAYLNFQAEAADSATEFHGEAGLDSVEQYPFAFQNGEANASQDQIPVPRTRIDGDLVAGSAIVAEQPYFRATEIKALEGPRESVFVRSDGKPQKRKYVSTASSAAAESFLLAQHTFYADEPSSSDNIGANHGRNDCVPNKKKVQTKDSSSTQSTAIMNNEKYRHKPRGSRYSTFSPRIDNAFSVIFHELELKPTLEKAVQDLEAKVLMLEQARKIQEGKEALTRNLNKESEARLRDEIAAKEKLIKCLQSGNEELKNVLEAVKGSAKRQEEEMMRWKAMFKSMIEPPTA